MAIGEITTSKQKARKRLPTVDKVKSRVNGIFESHLEKLINVR
jgi:hypothetical protein